jgi:hypothetical protein
LTLDQMPADLLGEEKRTGEIDRQQAVPFRPRDVDHLAAQIGAGIVDQHIDVAEAFERVGNNGLDALLRMQGEGER